MSGEQVFRRLVSLGLEPRHTLLDVGCGDLRVGKYLIPYLIENSYYGIEPCRELVDWGSRDLPEGLIQQKKPQYSDDSDFNLAGIFAVSFDYILISSVWTQASHVQIKRMLDSACIAGTNHAMILADYRVGASDYYGQEWDESNSICHTRECIEQAAGDNWTYEELDRVIYQWCVLRRRS